MAGKRERAAAHTRASLKRGEASPHDLPLWPTRVQLQRSEGWRKPPTAVSVARPHRYGNPHRVSDTLDAVAAVELYRSDLQSGRLPYDVDQVREDLAGRDLMCWCPPGQACHADVLLEVANSEILEG